MLFGEYAVLDGFDSVTCAFDTWMTATVSKREDGYIFCDSPRVLSAPLKLPSSHLTTDPPPGLEFVWACLKESPLSQKGLNVVLSSAFPREWGMGSSSAVTVALLGALDVLEGRPLEPPRITRLAIQLIRQVQGGVGSGYDAANQAWGGMIRYRMASGEGDPQVECLPLPGSTDPQLFPLWTGLKASTPSMVGKVREHHPVGDPLYPAIGALAEEAVSALKRRDWSQVGVLMDRGQGLLELLGAVPDAMKLGIHQARNVPGVCGLRLTGAGGGDTALLLADREETAQAAAAAGGFTLLPPRATAQGLHLREPSPPKGNP